MCTQKQQKEACEDARQESKGQKETKFLLCSTENPTTTKTRPDRAEIRMLKKQQDSFKKDSEKMDLILGQLSLKTALVYHISGAASRANNTWHQEQSLMGFQNPAKQKCHGNTTTLPSFFLEKQGEQEPAECNGASLSAVNNDEGARIKKCWEGREGAVTTAGIMAVALYLWKPKKAQKVKSIWRSVLFLLQMLLHEIKK